MWYQRQPLAGGYLLLSKQFDTQKLTGNSLNRNYEIFANLSNMKMVCVNQSGTYTFSLPIGKMAVVITYNGIYPHYSGSGGITANQLGMKGTETVITSVNNTTRTVNVYNNAGGATQAVILMPI